MTGISSALRWNGSRTCRRTGLWLSAAAARRGRATGLARCRLRFFEIPAGLGGWLQNSMTRWQLTPRQSARYDGWCSSRSQSARCRTACPWRGRGASADLEADDKVGYTMRFVRAAEGGRAGIMRRCLNLYPHLATLVADPMGLVHCGGAGLHAFRQHAVELAREAAINQLADLHGQGARASEEHNNRRERLFQTLRRLSPGRSTALPAARNARGQVLTDPAEMAAALRAHWSAVFASCRVDRHLLGQWLREDAATGGSPPVDSPEWPPRREDVVAAVVASPNSSPGPDGIPFLAWRELGPLATDMLYAAL